MDKLKLRTEFLDKLQEIVGKDYFIAKVLQTYVYVRPCKCKVSGWCSEMFTSGLLHRMFENYSDSDWYIAFIPSLSNYCLVVWFPVELRCSDL